jgi:hypothetical protein
VINASAESYAKFLCDLCDLLLIKFGNFEQKDAKDAKGYSGKFCGMEGADSLAETLELRLFLVGFAGDYLKERRAWISRSTSAWFV